MTRLRNTSLTIVYHIKKKPKYRIVFEFLNLMTLEIPLIFLSIGMLFFDFSERKW